MTNPDIGTPAHVRLPLRPRKVAAILAKLYPCLQAHQRSSSQKYSPPKAELDWS